MSLVVDCAQVRPGCLIPIGGAEDKAGARDVLRHVVQVSGGASARLIIIPSASTIPAECAAMYRQIFSELGIQDIRVLDIRSRVEANDRALVAQVADATGIFFTGGDQVRLLSLLGGTVMSRSVSEAFQRGATISGTSAGASALSEHMIAFGRDGSSPSQRMVQLAPGLGLTNCMTIDQHFRQRDRLGRLMTAVAYNPALLGIGIDEDTAFVIAPDQCCEVIGSGGVTIVDGSELGCTNIDTVKQHRAITVTGLKVHVLTQGYQYDLQTRQVCAPC